MPLRYADITASSVSNSPMQSASGKAMTEYGVKDTKLRGKASEETGARVRSFLRKQHPKKTADHVAADTGLSATTISTWLEGSTVPGGLAFIALIKAYGPQFLAEVIPNAPRWLDKAYREHRLAALEAEQARIDRELAQLRR